MFDHLDEYTLPGQCPQWNTISHHFLMVWHLRKLGMLSEETLKKTFGVISDTCNEIIGGTKLSNVDYDIFRFMKLSRTEVKNKI